MRKLNAMRIPSIEVERQQIKCEAANDVEGKVAA